MEWEDWESECTTWVPIVTSFWGLNVIWGNGVVLFGCAAAFRCYLRGCWLEEEVLTIDIIVVVMVNEAMSWCLFCQGWPHEMCGKNHKWAIQLYMFFVLCHITSNTLRRNSIEILAQSALRSQQWHRKLQWDDELWPKISGITCSMVSSRGMHAGFWHVFFIHSNNLDWRRTILDYD